MTISLTPEHSTPLQPQGWLRYLSFSTDHKVIGLQYLVCGFIFYLIGGCLLYTSPSPRDVEESRMPSSA